MEALEKAKLADQRQAALEQVPLRWAFHAPPILYGCIHTRMGLSKITRKVLTYIIDDNPAIVGLHQNFDALVPQFPKWQFLGQKLELGLCLLGSSLNSCP